MISIHQILSTNKYFIAFENKSFNILVLIRKKDFSCNIFHRWYLFWNAISRNIEKFHENVRLFDKFYFKSTTQMQSRKYICINLFYECIYIFILFFLVYLYRYTSIIIWYKKFSLNIVIKENCAPRKMKIFLCSNRFIDRCHQNEVPSKRKEEKETNSFLRWVFPFHEEPFLQVASSNFALSW